MLSRPRLRWHAGWRHPSSSRTSHLTHPYLGIAWIGDPEGLCLRPPFDTSQVPSAPLLQELSQIAMCRWRRPLQIPASLLIGSEVCCWPKPSISWTPWDLHRCRWRFVDLHGLSNLPQLTWLAGVLPGVRSITGLRYQCQNASHSRCPPGNNRTVLLPKHKLSCARDPWMEHDRIGCWMTMDGMDLGKWLDSTYISINIYVSLYIYIYKQYICINIYIFI